MESVFLSVVEKKEINQEERSIVAWGSRPVMDRDFEQIASDAKWELGNFQKNPVLMLSHDYSKPPVGKVIWTKVTPDGLRFKAQFAKTPAGEELWTLYRDGIMHSFSVGFLPLNFTEPDDVKSGEPRRIYNHLELLEISCVSVPSCPAAILEMYGAGEIKTKDISDVLAIIAKETPHEQKEETAVEKEEQDPGADSDEQQEGQKEVKEQLDSQEGIKNASEIDIETEEKEIWLCPDCGETHEDEKACGKPKKPKKGEDSPEQEAVTPKIVQEENLIMRLLEELREQKELLRKFMEPAEKPVEEVLSVVVKNENPVEDLLAKAEEFVFASKTIPSEHRETIEKAIAVLNSMLGTDEVDGEPEIKEIDLEIEPETPRIIELKMDEVQFALKELVGDFLSKRPDIAILVDERIRRAQGRME